MNEVTPVAHPIPRATQLTGLSRSQLYELMKRGELAFIKVGRRRLIAHADLQSLISRHRVAHKLVAPPQNTPDIGLLSLLDAMPGAWWPLLQKHLAERRPVTASEAASSEPGSDDLSNYEYLGREPGNSTEIVSEPPEGENYDDLDEVEEERPRRKIKQVEHSCGIERAIDMARSKLLELPSDYHEIVDSVHDTLRGTERIQRLESLACKIEKFAQLKVPAALSKLPVKFTLPKRRPWASNTAQAFDAVTILQASAVVLEGIVDGDQGHADAQVLSADLRSVMDAIKY